MIDYNLLRIADFAALKSDLDPHRVLIIKDRKGRYYNTKVPRAEFFALRQDHIARYKDNGIYFIPRDAKNQI